MCLYVMVAGRLPFEEAHLPTLFRRVTRADYTCPPWFSPGLVDVLALLLEPTPSKRCGGREGGFLQACMCKCLAAGVCAAGCSSRGMGWGCVGERLGMYMRVTMQLSAP